MLGVLITGFIIWHWYRDDPNQIVEVIVMSASVSVTVTIAMSMLWIVLHWRSRRESIVLKAANQVSYRAYMVLRLLLTDPFRKWHSQELSYYLRDCEYTLGSEGSDIFKELEAFNLITFDGDHIELQELVKRNSDYLITSLNDYGEKYQ